MSAAQRPPTYRLIDKLLQQPQQYQFFQAVRVLSRQLQHQEGADPDRLVGERIRFGSSLSLAFPPSEVESLESPSADSNGAAPYRLVPAFIGMTGPSGAMPRFYTEKLAERLQVHRDPTACAFMDVFNNRMVALFYKAWQKYRLPLRHESGKRFLPELLSLSGKQLGLESPPANTESIEPYAAYAGLLRHQPVSADNLRRVLADYFQTTVEVEQFVGQWFDIPHTQQTRLGGSVAILGESACCGARLWDRQSRLRLRFGPLRSAAYRSLLPDGAGASALRSLLQYWCGISVEFEVQLVLHRDDVRAARLNGSSGQLGRDAVICSRSVPKHIDEARYLLN
ncbi:type VI secretion system baseplate subunit TssG [Chitinimonas sp. BJB300]|uniref:type VI secretion system baseplate subunit TssG n=1 Tax=Chitinimonas sp. BJB300 TaxID=1559339 RepID=UPI000C0E3052|nr:type VI secretion system baseplate subunit TssG [Chitinimonas sp. BJB300]PHV13177.1 type VI secretion system baseplate subunit TssG [Chitinimonas sp. BJB300]TSJ87159.1 type VI secretion system baseplate subunit TssG [Chitinimonas sp. BJB300]